MSYGVTGHVGICVEPAVQPDRIALHIAPDGRVIVSEVVVADSRLGAEVLPREAQVVDEGAQALRILIRRADPEGIRIEAPAQLVI